MRRRRRHGVRLWLSGCGRAGGTGAAWVWEGMGRGEKRGEAIYC